MNKVIVHVVVEYLLEVDSCGKKIVHGYVMTISEKIVCSEGCKRECNGCKGIPQDQFGWIPKLTAWTGRVVNRTTPGTA